MPRNNRGGPVQGHSSWLMVATAVFLLASICLSFAPAAASAGCPLGRAARKQYGMEEPSNGGRQLKQLNLLGGLVGTVTGLLDTVEVSVGYKTAAQNILNHLKVKFASCSFTADPSINLIANPNGPMDSAAAVRLMFHDAGTYDKNNKTKGGANGSIANKCCTDVAGLNSQATTKKPYAVAAGATCPDGTPGVGAFTDGKTYCCPNNRCIAKTLSGQSVSPVCLPGNKASTEVCRRENDGLFDITAKLREIQVTHGKYLSVTGLLTGTKYVTMADIIVLAAGVAIEKCSYDHPMMKLTYIIGRADRLNGDAPDGLPSVEDVVAARNIHNNVFEKLGLTIHDQATLVSGSHSIGGYRRLTSGTAECLFETFDCTPGSEFADRTKGEKPFDNNAFKVACAPVDLSLYTPYKNCNWNTKCPVADNYTMARAAGCPFSEAAYNRFLGCEGPDNVGPDGAAINIGNRFQFPDMLESDKFLCKETAAQSTMLKYARNETAFYEAYLPAFIKLQLLGFDTGKLVTVAVSV